MATALQRQLAQISANSIHQLDLKAQKTQHARSLLFDPSDAARQSFDDIYHICIEGFEELCQLDARFAPFGSNLFSESSKDIDRGQLTRKENEDLDGILERFLGLVQGRLLLKPAQKSVEWLVRRWKVHEFNTETLLVTFLPYHTDQRVFPALLAILPTDKQLPESFRWLHPYIASLSYPPRHAVLAAAVSNRGFFAAFNSYVLRVAKAGHTSGLLLGFWAGLMAQAVNSMLDSSRSGRDSVKRTREEESLLKILPVLQEALNVGKKGKLDEMFVGACMIVTILATKASLSDAVLDAMMEAVAGSWTERTMNDGLACLAVVAEEKADASLPAFVTRALLKEHVLASLTHQAESRRVSKLSAGWAVGILHSASQEDDASNLHVVKAIVEAELLQESDTLVVIEALMSERQKLPEGNASSVISEILLSLLNSERHSRLLQQSGRRPGLPEPNHLDDEPEPVSVEEMELDLPSKRPNDQSPTELADFNKMLDTLPELPSELYSFFEPGRADTDLFLTYSRALHAALESEPRTEAFLDLRSLHRSSLTTHPTLFSFLARVWTSGNSTITTAARVKALMVAGSEIEKLVAHARSRKSEGNAKDQMLDLQALFPYLLTALADERRRVREVAAEVCRTVEDLYGVSKAKNESDWTIWGRQSIYSSDASGSTGEIQWLSGVNAHKFLQTAIVPVLEDCILDSGHLVRHMVEMLDHATGAGRKERKQLESLSRDLRQSVCNFLASHARATPVLRLELSLLRVLGKVSKEGRPAREQVLLPFVKEWIALSKDEVADWCEKESVRVREMDVAVLEVLEHRSEEEMKLLRNICSAPSRKELVEVAFERQRRLWPALKSVQTKVDVFEWLLELALSQDGRSEMGHDLALDTLRALQLSPEVAVHMLESLPAASDLDTHPPASKRQRRISETERARVVDYGQIEMVIRRITLVLELLESSKQDAPILLRPLFHLLAELRQFKNRMGSELVYLHSMLLDTILSVVSHLQATPTAVDQLNRDVIRTDLLIDCIRSTPFPQIHNTALLVVSALASLAPESVLHSVIPLFTFMSSTVLRKTDEYSAHVTDQAVTRIVPALSDSLKSKGNNLLGGVSELLLSFVAAWEHVPLHRRLGLFEMLVRSVGVEDCLGVVAAMLVERYSNTPSSVSSFVAELVSRFEAVTTLRAANQWLQLVFDGLNPKPKTKQKNTSLSDLLLAFSDKNEEEQEEALETMLEGLAALLRNETVRERLVTSLATGGDEEATNIRSAYAALTEQVIQLTQHLAASSPTLQAATDGLLSAILSLLPTPDFIASCAQLMQSGSASTREQVFHSLESRVHSTKSSNTVQRQTFLDVLPSCAVFVSKDQPVQVRLAAIGCIDAICDKFGKSDRESVKNAADKVAGDAALGAGDDKLRSFSLLCLARIAGVLEDGDESISIFPNVVSLTLDCLASSTAHEADSKEVVRQGPDSKALQDAEFRLLTAVLDHIPWILASAPQELDRALTLAAKVEDEDDGAVGEFKALTTKKVPALELFKSIERTWSKEIEQLEAGRVLWKVLIVRTMRSLLGILHQAVQYHSKATMTKNSSILFSLLLKAFDLRRQSRSKRVDIDVSEDENEYAMVDQLALDTTLKMNDATFRPFFIRLVEWATFPLPGKDAKGRHDRMTSLYSFALLFFEKLKSLVTSYMSFLLDSASEVLHAFSEHAIDNELLQLVVKTLGSSFRSDEDDFWTAPAHFDVIASPLIDLLTTTYAQPADEMEGVISTITDLAAAVTASPEQLKAINSTLLSLLGHESANARLAAVQCQRSITKRVTFDWLALLPEILPAISELQEDDDERVEYQTLLWVKEIEEISGESLEEMLA